MAKPAKWSLKVEHLMACNCNYACPCSFDARPTFGTCEASTATRIVKGKVDGVTLDGLKWAFVAKWPGPLHELHGRGVVFLDDRAMGAKRDALERVATGQAGGPWGIFMSTVTDGYQVRTAGIEFRAAGKRSHYRVVGATEVAFESIKHPLTGAEYPATVLLPAGLLTKKEEIFAAKTMWVKADGLDFSYPQRNALVFTTTWRGP